MSDRVSFLHAAKEFIAERHPDALFAYLAGSIVRDEATAFSDIDLVIVFEKVARPKRGSTMYQGWPIEWFIHDPETVNYFFQEIDGKDGSPALPQMVLEGITIPRESAVSIRLKRLANEIIERGPPSLANDELRNRRYAITDLIDDLRAPRSKREAIASGARLHDILGDFYLRAQGKWSGSGKGLPRALDKVSLDFSKRFSATFETFFQSGDPSPVVQLSEEILQPYGGTLFDDYERDAPESWRLPLP